MLESKPKAIVFDWDNTIINSWPKTLEAMNLTLEKFGRKRIDLEEAKLTAHRSLKDSFPDTFGDEWIDARDYFYQVFQFDLKNFPIDPLPAAIEMLKYLNDVRLPISILSNKRGDILRAEVEFLELAKQFTKVIGSLDADEDKPSKVAFKMAADHFGADYSDIWLIGDSDIDIECARSSGAVPVLYGDGKAAPMLIDEARFQFRSWHDFLRLIKLLYSM